MARFLAFITLLACLLLPLAAWDSAAQPAATPPVPTAPAAEPNGSAAPPADAGPHAAAPGAPVPAATPAPEGAAAPAPAPAPARNMVGTLPHDLSPWGMFVNADIVVQAVMVGLALASVITWTVWLAKSIELMTALRRGRTLLGRLAAARSLDEASAVSHGSRSAVAQLAEAAMEEADLSAGLSADGLKERVASRLDRIEVAAARRMTRGTGLLATIGATAPFVGLFGTVWGIMNAFVGISRAQTTNLAVVAPGIAEALLATAIGLVAAIPAVVIYNVFARWIAGYRLLLGDASAEIMRHVSRDLDRSRQQPLLRAAE